MIKWEVTKRIENSGKFCNTIEGGAAFLNVVSVGRT